MALFLIRYRKALFLGGLFVLTVSLWQIALYQPDPRELSVHFFDVGQGDSALIIGPNNTQILIDGGPSAAVLERVGSTLGFFDRSIDLVVLTHPDKDHLAGLIDILDRYTVAAVLTTAATRETTLFKVWEEKLQKEGARIIYGRAGMWAEISPGIGLVVLSPGEALAAAKTDKTNNASLVLKLVYGETSFLFTGDIERPVEELLVHQGINLDADVLKVPHHGSKTSSSQNFLNAVTPEIAVFSLGNNNSYGHPHSEVVERFALSGAAIYRTDLQGTITVVSDGENLTVRK
ncbi:MAG: ComEC/Rec2 family competence protein [bacterium]|nr:ComEC/Rec2 family competence protein [bacterium]MDZ4295759.1 ComEC/Rec2 family competence protein [Patescibacteria group bacterium]